MRLHRAYGEGQPRGDRLVRPALGDQREDLTFAFGESESGSSRRRPPSRRETIVGSMTVSPSRIRRRASTTVAMSKPRSLSKYPMRSEWSWISRIA